MAAPSLAAMASSGPYPPPAAAPGGLSALPGAEGAEAGLQDGALDASRPPFAASLAGGDRSARAPAKTGEPLLATRLRGYGGALELMVAKHGQLVDAARPAPTRQPVSYADPGSEEDAMASLDAIRGELDALGEELRRVKAADGNAAGSIPRSTMGRPVPPPKVHPLARLRRDEILAARREDWERALAAHAAPTGRAEASALSHVVARLLPLGQLADTLLDEAGRLNVEVVAREYELLDMCLRETARQVGSTMSERGTLVEDIRSRLSELVGVVVGEAHAMQRRESARLAKLQHVKSELAGTASELSLARGDLATAREARDVLTKELDATRTALAEARAMHEAAAAHLRAENDDLRNEVTDLRIALADMEGERDAAAGRVKAAMEDEMSHLEDERDDVLSRLRFVENQLKKARAESKAAIPELAHTAVQTDAVAAPSAALREETEEPKEKAPKKKRRDRPAELGIFASFIAVGVKGRAKTRGWMLRTLMQLYSDKAAADTRDLGEGLPASSLADYAYQWHLNRFGLRGLADQNLADLCATAKKLASESTFVAQFCGFAELPEGAARPSGDEASAFYVQLYAHLASGDAGTFASGANATKDSGEGTLPMIRPDAVHSAARDLLKVFINPQVEDASPEPGTVAADIVVNAQYAEAVHELVQGKLPILRSADGSYSLELVLHAFMDEWTRRRKEQEDALHYLWHAADTDGSKSMSYDEFRVAVRQVDSGMSDRALAKIYRDALNITAEAAAGKGAATEGLEHEHVSADAFVAAMRKHGFGRRTFTFTARADADAGVGDDDDDGTKETRDLRLRMMLEDAMAPGEATAQLCSKLDEVYNSKPKASLPIEVHDMVARAQAQREHVVRLMLDPTGDVDAAWGAFRILVSMTRTSLVRVKGTLRAAADAVRLSNAMAKKENTGLMQLLKPLPTAAAAASTAEKASEERSEGHSARKTLLLSPDL